MHERLGFENIKKSLSNRDISNEKIVRAMYRDKMRRKKSEIKKKRKKNMHKVHQTIFPIRFLKEQCVYIYVDGR